MKDDLISAILIPPQLEQFREVCNAPDVLEVNVSGWYKHVILTPDRAFLFPRSGEHVAAIEREANVLSVLEPLGLPFVPRLLGRWHDSRISPYPFIATSRMPGVPYESVRPMLTAEQVAAVMSEVGRTIADWHNVDIVRLPSFMQADSDPLFGLLGKLTSERTQAEALAEVEGLLAPELDGKSIDQFRESFEELARMPPVLLHGDMCGNQLLVDDELRITGVVDWGKAHVGHPLRDFLFGEWSLELFDFEAYFGVFRKEMWHSYQKLRNVRLPSHESVHALFTLAESCFVVEQMASQSKPTEWLRRHHELCLANLRAIFSS